MEQDDPTTWRRWRFVERAYDFFVSFFFFAVFG